MKTTLAGLAFLLSTCVLPAVHAAGSGFASPLIQNVSNAPNPFDSRRGGLEGQTQITYELADASAVHVTVYDLFGFKVQEWNFSAGSAGGQTGRNGFLWDGRNSAGTPVAKGGYLAYIEVVGPQGTAKTIRKIGVIH